MTDTVEIKYVTKVLIDLSNWFSNYPSGCILYHFDEVIDSEYCNNAEDYKYFLNRNKDLLQENLFGTEVQVLFDMDDLEDETAIKCAKEVRDYIYNLKENAYV